MTQRDETEQVVSVLKQTRSKLIDLRDNPPFVGPRFPWRNYPDDEPASKRPNYNEMIDSIEHQIIDIEQAAYRDPVQDAEMRAEMYAEMALTGVRDDPSLYMHTPFEEELFQEQIRHDIDYGYYDEDGSWNEGLYGDALNISDCPTCGTQGVSWDDGECVSVDDEHDFCYVCAEEAIAFVYFLAYVTNHEIEVHPFETAYWFRRTDLWDGMLI